MNTRHETAHYWACSDSQELEFTTEKQAWDYVSAHADEGFDCVVESFWY